MAKLSPSIAQGREDDFTPDYAHAVALTFLLVKEDDAKREARARGGQASRNGARSRPAAPSSGRRDRGDRSERKTDPASATKLKG